eukprot:3324647-Amphidinium_carterae.3
MAAEVSGIPAPVSSASVFGDGNIGGVLPPSTDWYGVDPPMFERYVVAILMHLGSYSMNDVSQLFCFGIADSRMLSWC